MITLTETAAEHVKAAIDKRGKGLGLRVGVKGAGCSGLQYTIEYCDKISDDDVVFTNYDVKVVIDAIALPMLEGAKLDYVKQGLGEGFEFSNPNVVGECGCGHSFSV